jgi:hypothetical protein
MNPKGNDMPLCQRCHKRPAEFAVPTTGGGEFWCEKCRNLEEKRKNRWRLNDPNRTAP